ncbi:uncharacterized protein CMU_017690 [Cryptosporidium muris RN66]|uniref:Ribosome biogenesis protein NOP53 n=1 Tax=Cryptosporidium muris (strain RN66) TaxID=441375 RepID=B6AD11_CRYMR|nr:uncharacterized protein CMU_017690 [Cryptosporidium muris RN66]EEA06015.1 hypothetical protein CMU_017690 [Cryptosporidium muris RN66]|eukprot:XP_002140364.1 hypothetical protein [Cryptosporidium muris RN66]
MGKSKKSFKKISNSVTEELNSGFYELLKYDELLSKGLLFSLDELGIIKANRKKNDKLQSSIESNNLENRANNFPYGWSKSHVAHVTALAKKNHSLDICNGTTCSLKPDLDIWKDSLDNTSKLNASHNKSLEVHKKKYQVVHIPHSGQSINPLETERQKAVILAATPIFEDYAITNDFRLGKVSLRSILLNYYEEDLLNNLSDELKVRLLLQINNGRIPDLLEIEHWKKATEEKPLVDYKFSNKHETARVCKKSKRKTQADRNRLIRNRNQKRVTEERILKKTLNRDVDKIGELEALNKRLEQKREYRDMLRNEIRFAQSRGIINKLRIGKNRYVEPTMNVYLTEDVQKSEGSLRKVHIKGTLSNNIVSNIYKKGLVELPSVQNARYGRRLIKILRKKRLSRKPAKRYYRFHEAA